MLPEELKKGKTDIIAAENLGIIMTRFTTAKEYVKPWHDKILFRRRLYNLNHYNTPAKPQELRYPDPTPLNTVDLAVGILMANDMVWKGYGWEPDMNEDEDTSDVEKYIAGTLDINNEREQTDIPYQVALGFVRDGESVLYSWWDTKRHKLFLSSEQVIDEDEESGVANMAVFKETPVCMKYIDPMEISMLPGGPKERWLHIFRETEMSIYDAEKLYGVVIEQYKGTTEDYKMRIKDRLIDYWRYAEIAEDGKDELVVINAVIYANKFLPGFEPRIMEGYEDLPYTVGFFKPVDQKEPANWGHSILDPQESSIRFLEESVNRRMRQINMYSSMPPVIKTQRGRNVEVDPGLGIPVIIDVNEDVGWPVWPGNPPDVDKHIEYLRSRIQQSGFADVMYGSGPSQVSGYALSQLGDQNRIRLEQPVAHLELLWTTWARKILRLTKNFAKDSIIRVYGKLRGENFATEVIGSEVVEYMIKCEVVASYPNEQTRKTALATQVAPFLSKRTIMQDYLNVQQPDDERERQLIEAAEEHPIMKMYGVINALMTRAKDGDEAAQMAIDQIKAEQMGGGKAGPQAPGREEGGPNPQQLLGLRSPTGEMTPQEQGMQPPGQSMEEQIGNMANAAPGMEGLVR